MRRRPCTLGSLCFLCEKNRTHRITATIASKTVNAIPVIRPAVQNPMFPDPPGDGGEGDGDFCRGGARCGGGGGGLAPGGGGRDGGGGGAGAVLKLLPPIL